METLMIVSYVCLEAEVDQKIYSKIDFWLILKNYYSRNINKNFYLALKV